MKNKTIILLTTIITFLTLSAPSVYARNKNHTYLYRNIDVVYDLDGNILKSNKYFNNPGQNHQTFHVEISYDEFSPSILRINKGDTIIWTNLESRPHTVTGNGNYNNYIKSKKLNKGNTYSKTFNATGTFRYHDIYNPDVKAKIVVQNQ